MDDSGNGKACLLHPAVGRAGGNLVDSRGGLLRQLPRTSCMGSGVLTSEQLKQTFARRFSDAKRYHGYLLSLNSQSKLTIWYALPRAIQEYLILDKIRDMQLFLAGLEHLSL